MESCKGSRWHRETRVPHARYIHCVLNCKVQVAKYLVLPSREAVSFLFVFHSKAVHPKSHRVGVCFQLLILRHADNGLPYAAYAVLVEVLESHLAVVTVKVHAVVGKRVLMGGKRMVRAAGLVARALTCPLAKEHAAGINHLIGKSLIIRRGND